jgi:hypothetical protein
MLVTHPFLLLLGLIAVHKGFDEIAADERSTAAGGGLIGSLLFHPFCVAVLLTLMSFALFSLLFALLAIPRHHSDTR